MTEQEMIETLAKLQMLCVNYVERNTSLRIEDTRSFDRLIQSRHLVCTYGDAAKNLATNMFVFCQGSTYLVNMAKKLKIEILNSNIKDLRFGIEPQKKFSTKENEYFILLSKMQLDLQYKYYNKMTMPLDEVASLFEDIMSKEKMVELCEKGEFSNVSKTDDKWRVDLFEVANYVEDMSFSRYNTK